MKKGITKIINVCDDCEEYPARYKCKECHKEVCHNCVRSFSEFQRRVKSSSLHVIHFCPDCSKKDIPLLNQLRHIQKLRDEWWEIVARYDELAEAAENGIDDEEY